MQMSQVFAAPEMASLSGWGEAPLVLLCLKRTNLTSKPHYPFSGSKGGSLIFGIYVYFRDAGLRAGMVGRRVPFAFEQLHSAEFLERDTAPVFR